eukprot:3180474-Prymnesium_polylepis.2
MFGSANLCTKRCKIAFAHRPGGAGSHHRCRAVDLKGAAADVRGVLLERCVPCGQRAAADPYSAALVRAVALEQALDEVHAAARHADGAR